MELVFNAFQFTLSNSVGGARCTPDSKKVFGGKCFACRKRGLQSRERKNTYRKCAFFICRRHKTHLNLKVPRAHLPICNLNCHAIIAAEKLNTWNLMLRVKKMDCIIFHKV